MKAISLACKYPISIISYAIYFSLGIFFFMSDWNYHQEIIRNHGVRIGGVREANGLVLVLYPIAITFVIVSIANALSKENNKFYLWLIAFIIMPLVIYSNVF